MLHLTEHSLDMFMPMHLIVDANGSICGVGPTLSKLFPETKLVGQAFDDFFELSCDGCVRCGQSIPENKRLCVTSKLTSTHGAKIRMKGISAPMGKGGKILLNISFGISIVDAVAKYRLTAGDFAHTDLAIEMLYLVEAKSAVLEETKQLNMRLQGAKVAAEEQAFTDTLTGLKNRRAMDHARKSLIFEIDPELRAHPGLQVSV